MAEPINPEQDLKALIKEKYIKNEHKESFGLPKFIDSNRPFTESNVISMESYNESYTNILRTYSDSLKKILNSRMTASDGSSGFVLLL